MYAELCRALCIAAYTEPSVYAELLFVTARPYESFGSASYKEEEGKCNGGTDLNAIVNIDEL